MLSLGEGGSKMKTDKVGGKLSRGSDVYLPQRISVMRRKVLATMVRSLRVLQLCRASLSQYGY